MSITTTRWITRLLVWLLIALGTAEALYGFGQLMGLWPSGHSLYRLTGSFYNPGPYMGYLALSLPLCLHEWMRPAQGFARWRQRAAMTAAALILCLLPAGMSRAAWAAATAAAGYVLWMHHRKRILRGMRRHRQRAVVCLAAGVLVLAAAAAGAYLMKKDSADGRRLMWKVAAQAVCRRPWTGCGWHRVAGAYGDAQEAYFAAGRGTPAEERVAGSPEYVFNEYLRTTCRHQEPHIRRMPGWRDFRRNDVLVFNFPYPQRWDSIGFDILKYYVKRCIALPGDTVEIRRSRYRVRGCGQTPGWLQGQEELAALARMEERGCAPGGLSRRAYPLDDRLPWTIHEFGPLYVPARGDSLRMDRQNALLYRNLIEWEQKRKLALRGDSVMMGDSLLRGYRFRQDYYFVGGDRAVNSQDSRYWGLLPEPYIVGRVVRIWKSERPGDGRIRWERVMKRVR